MKRTLLLALACVAILLGAAAVRAVWAGNAALDDGDAAIRRDDPAAAIAHYRRAARWYVPLAGATGTALERLERLATAAEARGDAATGRSAWLAIRTATIAIRGATAPFDDARTRADARLAAMLAAQPNPSAGATAEARTAYHTRVLSSSTRPTRALLLVSVLGLALLAASFVLATRTPPRPRRLTLSLAAAGALLWTLGLVLA